MKEPLLLLDPCLQRKPFQYEREEGIEKGTLNFTFHYLESLLHSNWPISRITRDNFQHFL